MNAIDVIKNKFLDLGCVDSSVVKAMQEIEQLLELYSAVEKTLYDTELYLVYKHTDPLGKIYIGITRNLPNSRWNEGAGYEKQGRFYRAIQKFGWVHFGHEIIAAGLTEAEARKIENETIIALRAYDEKFGYNTQVSLPKEVVSGSEQGGNPPSEKIGEILDKQKNSFSPNEIAETLVSKLSLKTFGGKLLWRQNELYVPASKTKIKQELLLTYNIPPHKHSDMLERIKILSATEEPCPTGLTFINDRKDFLIEFCQDVNLELLPGNYIANADLYNKYTIWANQQGAPVLSKTVFSKRVVVAMKTACPTFIRCRTGSSRGWKVED